MTSGISVFNTNETSNMQGFDNGLLGYYVLSSVKKLLTFLGLLDWRRHYSPTKLYQSTCHNTPEDLNIQIVNIFQGRLYVQEQCDPVPY